ncbi:MAG: hypothetical protein K2L51_01230 [Clostridiales bacterium]|nr:hypothetical protein [Clostridiales bacterium]
MYKKLISLILGVILCGSVFAGCALIEHNDEKDARQIVAVIDPIEDNSVEGKPYKSEKRVIYKSELISTMNQYASTYMQNYGLSLKETTERLLDEMITRELLLVEADRIRAQGLIEWTQKDKNDVMRTVYSTLDSQIASIKREILSERGESASDSDTSSDSTSATYPTKPSETTDEDYSDYEFDGNNIKYETNEDGSFKLDEDGEKIPVYKVWKPEEKDYPCLWGSENQQSLDREAMRRLVSLLESAADADIRAAKADKAKFKEAKKQIDDVVNTQGWEGVYPMLGDNYYVQYLLGKNAEQSVLIGKLQSYITSEVTVTSAEVTDAYNSQLAYQVATYDNDASAYQTAVSDGSTTMLYYLDDSYFFVKHILLPFSDEQTAKLAAFKADPRNADKDPKAFRASLVNDIVVYPHVDGENDTENPTNVDTVFATIQNAMRNKSDKEAERLFDDFTYDYNTDPGAFGQGKSYAVKRGDDEGHSGYMEEFYDGAMELATQYRQGDLLDHYVVTDYGVHIMYFSQNITGGTERRLDDPLTPAGYSTVRQTIEDTIRTAKENNAFTVWQNERITYYQESQNVVHTYRKRYKSLYKD